VFQVDPTAMADGLFAYTPVLRERGGESRWPKFNCSC
jgi:hypothetical protein